MRNLIILVLLASALCVCVGASSSSSSVPAPLISHPQWSAHSIPEPSSTASFRIALYASNPTAINNKFETTFDPDHSEYLQYPSEDEIAQWTSPSHHVMHQLHKWLKNEVCTNDRSSCKATFAPYNDSLVISMEVREMESYLTSSAARTTTTTTEGDDAVDVTVQLHTYQHRNNEMKCLRAVSVSSSSRASPISTLLHVIPSHLHSHISHITGLIDFPHEVRSTNGVEAKKAMKTSDETVVAASPHVDSSIASTSYPLNSSTLVVPGGNMMLTRVMQVVTYDSQIMLNQFFPYCSANSTAGITWPLIIYADGLIASCPIGNNVFNFDHAQFDLLDDPVTQNVVESTTYNDVLQLGRAQDGTLTAVIPQPIVIGTSNNYFGYTLKITLAWYGFDANTNKIYYTTTYLHPFRLSPTQLITPSFLRSYVGLPDNFQAQNASTRLGIGALVVNVNDNFTCAFYSPSDLSQFWSEQNLNGNPNVEYFDYTQTTDNSTVPNEPQYPDPETTLDVQYGAAMLNGGVGTTSIFHVASTTPFDDIMDGVLGRPADLRPKTLSFSYDMSELIGEAKMNHTNIKFQLLALTGISVFISTGDTGSHSALGLNFTDIASVCQNFNPLWPATSPYVTAVGASQLSASELNQCPHPVQCSQEFGGLITAGGGFSTAQQMPSYQSQSIAEYLANPNCTKPISGTFDPTMRVIPDIAMFGHDYPIVIQGADQNVDGTSAATPAAAGIFAVIMEKRAAVGLPPLGFLNKMLYKAARDDPRTFIDITEGSNRCLSAGSGCCSAGYYACNGFDAATGLGQPNFKFLLPLLGVNVTGDTITDNVICIPTHSSRTLTWLIIVGCIVGFLLLLGAGLFLWRRNKMKRVESVQTAHMMEGTYQRM